LGGRLFYGESCFAGIAGVARKDYGAQGGVDITKKRERAILTRSDTFFYIFSIWERL